MRLETSKYKNTFIKNDLALLLILFGEII